MQLTSGPVSQLDPSDQVHLKRVSLLREQGSFMEMAKPVSFMKLDANRVYSPVIH